MDGLIVLRDFEQAVFYPVRHMHVTKVLRVGDIYYVSIQLKDIVELDSDNQVRSNQLEQFNKLILPALGSYPNPPGDNLDNLVFLGTNFAYNLQDTNFQGHAEDREYSRWGNLIDALGDLPVFSDIDFYRVVDLRDQLEHISIIRKSSDGSARYVLNKGSLYTLQVVQRTYTGRQGNSAVLAPRRLKLDADTQMVQIVHGAHSITGKYDIYPLSFRIPANASGRYTSLFISVQRIDQNHVVETPDVQIPIVVLSTQRQIFLNRTLFVIFFAASIALLLSPLFGNIRLLPGLTLGPDAVQRVSVLVLIVLNAVAPGLVSRMEIALPTRSGG